MAETDEPIFTYIVTRGDTLRFALRVSPGGEPMDWGGASAEIVVGLKGGDSINLASPDDITLVAPDDLEDEEAPNLIAILTPEQTAELTASSKIHRYQVKVTDALGDVTTVLKGEIDARRGAAEAP